MTTFPPGSVDQALSLAAKGFAVFPLAGKHPLTPNGFKDAVSTPNEIRALWKQYGRAATGVGIATGPASGVWVLDVDVSSKSDKHGDESLAMLEQKFGELPETYTVLTGSGEDGKHLYFRHVDGITNSAGKVEQDIDVRADGGYVVAEGSTHPDTDGPYLQDLGQPDFIAEAPPWLLDLVLASSAGESATPVKPSAKWDELLKDWTLIATLRNGDRLYRRPGKKSGEHSAVLHASTPSYPDGYLYNFSPNSPGMEANTLYGVKIDPYENERHLIERWEAIFAEDAAKEDEEEEENSWLPKSIKDALLQGEVPGPDLMYRADGEPMLYKGKLNYMYGPPECGKSWATHLAVKQVLKDKGDVVYLDFENDVRDFAEHMQLLDVPEEHYDESVVFFSPEQKIDLRTDIDLLTEKAARRRLGFLAVLDKGPDLIVLDGVSNAMSCFGFNPLDNAEVILFERDLLRPLMKFSHGAGLVCIDHAPKNTAEGAKASIFGAQHKLALVTGVTYHFKTVAGEEFGRDKKGRSRITIMKDKPGHLRRLAATDSHFGDLVIDSTGPKMKIEITVPDELAMHPANLMEDASRWLEANDPATRQEVIKGVDSDGDEKYVRGAIDALLREGFIGEDMPPGGKLYHKKPFRQFASVEDLVPAAVVQEQRKSSSDPVDQAMYRSGKIARELESKQTVMPWPEEHTDRPTSEEVKRRTEELEANPDFAHATGALVEAVGSVGGRNQPRKPHPDFPHQTRPLDLGDLSGVEVPATADELGMQSVEASQREWAAPAPSKRQKMEPQPDDKIEQALTRVNALLKLQGKPLLTRESYFAELAKVNDEIEESNAALELLEEPTTTVRRPVSPETQAWLENANGERPPATLDPRARALALPVTGSVPARSEPTFLEEHQSSSSEEAPEASERSGEAGGDDEDRDPFLLQKVGGSENLKNQAGSSDWAADL